ncbi:MAG: NADH-quinone oxidoreductase subunit A [bacterium]|jgi:NADH-quinone oxidoreductase subunit A|nr:NADH-quinone oxidoreductase subunit A [bacterium]
MQFAFGVVLVFMVMGLLIGVVALALSSFIRPHNPTELKLQIYECGETPVGSPWMQFNNRFYTVALVFIIFDVEVVFLFPWAVVFKELGAFAFLEMLVFVGILAAGLVYAWAKGDLEWVRSRRFLRAAAAEKGRTA